MSFVRAGTLGGTAQRPFMDLTFTCAIYRVKTTQDAMGSLKEDFNRLPGQYSCDIAPMSDIDIFTQSGEQEVVTHILHFYAGTDIRQSDVVRILSSKKLSGIINGLYEVNLRLEPSQSISFIRCHAKYGTAPTKSIKL